MKELKINENQYLTEVLENGVVPTNCILDKTIPGLGATHSEIIAKRNSIIIEPNIPVILGKVGSDKSKLAVYEATTDTHIEKYLNNENITYKKVLCTPESYIRFRNIAIDLGVNIYQEYFCLFDECEKITQDIGYRELIALPIRDFFFFENKAFVSATPLELRNPDFKTNGFFKLKIAPQYEYRKNIDLIITNNYDIAVIRKLNELKDSERICVFLNSTNGLNKLINHLESQGITDYKAFCSSKSVKKFKERNIKRSFEKLDLPLAKYNFFTSRFFSAVDIFMDKQPDILILTDLNEAEYTMIDPKTEAIQIYGRFRKPFEDGKKFKSLTHITNLDNSEIILTEPEIEAYLEEAGKIHDELTERLKHEINLGKRRLLETDLKKITYNRFINDDGTKNFFSVDNFFDEERVKGYYTSAERLIQAYIETDHLIPNSVIYEEILADTAILKYKRLPSERQAREHIVNILDSVSESGSTQMNIDFVKNQLVKFDNRKRVETAEYIISAYEKLGGNAIRNVQFMKAGIDRLLKQYDGELTERKMFSRVVREAIREKLSENSTYSEVEVKSKLQDVFNVYGVEVKVKFSTIGKYFGVDKLKGKHAKGMVKLWKFQPDEEYD